MSVVISGILVITSFILASVLMFGTFLTTSTTQSQSLKDLAKINREKVGSAIDITSGSVTSTVTGSNTDIRLLVGNTGSQLVPDLSEMDVIVQYTDDSGNLVLGYLTYNSGGAGDNEWTSPPGGIAPDDFNPNIWDPDEVLTIDLRVASSVKWDTSALVVVATARAATDQISVTNN